jgi:hypothetical protein
VAEAKNRVLAGECISRAQLDAAGDTSLDAIRAALAALDHERAAMLAIARARAGEPVPVALAGEILPGIELPAITCALIAVAAGDRAELLDVIEHRRFPQGKDTAELEAIVLYAAARAGAPVARVVPELRRLAARSMTAEGYALLAKLAATIDDPNVAAATKPIASFAKDYAKQAAADERAMTASVADVVAALPAEVEVSRGGFTVRAAKSVGRNDPCPCGSGLKYKKCCADKPVATPSPIPGVSWDAFLAGDRLEPKHVAELALRDLARVDLARVPEPAVQAIAERYTRAHLWAHAGAAVEELAKRGSERAADARDALVLQLLDCGQVALAREHVAKLPAELAALFELELAIAEGPAAAWPALVRTAQAAVGSADKVPDLELAYALLRAAPALGIVAARACIGTLHVDDADLLLERVEDARDHLNLPPTDPAWDVLDELTAKAAPKAADDAGQLRAALQTSAARADELERQLAAMRAQLDSERTRPAAELTRADARPSGVEDKVRELEAMIREGNAERRELRRQLEAASEAPRTDEPRRAHGHDATRGRRGAADDAGADDELADALPPGARGTVIPRFDRRATDALGEVPAAVAAEAMRTIGTLAAGDGFAWRGVKQAKDMARQVLMMRVGIHHRLLFRVEDGVMDVLDLITREQLMTTLKRLRATR